MSEAYIGDRARKRVRCKLLQAALLGLRPGLHMAVPLAGLASRHH